MPTASRGAGAPTVTELDAFVAVAEELHFSRAARRLGVAAPSLSQTLRRLESKLGAVLLERTPRAVRLTAAGEELLPRARDILARMDLARRAVGDHSASAAATLTVGIVSNGFAELTAPILSAFRERHPAVRVVIRDVTTEDANPVLAGTADILLARPPIRGQDDPRLVVEDLIAEERWILLPSAHRLAEAESVSIADVADEAFVRVGPSAPSITGYWAAAAERDGDAIRFGTDAWSVVDVLFGVAYLGNVITSIPSVPRFYSVPGIAGVPLRDVPPAMMSLVMMAGERRAVVDRFADAARAVCDRLDDIVPHAWRLPSPSM